MAEEDGGAPRLRLARRARQAIGFLWVLSVLGSVGLVGGAALDDRAIARHPGRAVATVESTAWGRADITFTTARDGKLYSPRAGVAYPKGLSVGQRVWVDYDTTNPDRVKVAGRGAWLALVPALLSIISATIIALFLRFLVGVAAARRRA